MKKIVVVYIPVMLLFAHAAHAGGFATVKSWISLEVAAFVLSAVLTVIGGALGVVFRRISQTLKAVGEFMTELGTALEDSRLTREELAALIKEGSDIFAVWK